MPADRSSTSQRQGVTALVPPAPLSVTDTLRMYVCMRCTLCVCLNVLVCLSFLPAQARAHWQGVAAEAHPPPQGRAAHLRRQGRVPGGAGTRAGKQDVEGDMDYGQILSCCGAHSKISACVHHGAFMVPSRSGVAREGAGAPAGERTRRSLHVHVVVWGSQRGVHIFSFLRMRQGNCW